MIFRCLAKPLCFLLLLLLLFAVNKTVLASQPFDFASLASQAEELASHDYLAPEPLPEILASLSYDDWRNIRQRPDKAYWRESKRPFNLQFFHPGFVYDRSVRINILAKGQVSPLNIQRDWFDYSGVQQAPQIPEQVGAAGFRVHNPLKTKKYFDEFLVFLGGSYLRGVSKETRYGLSARGLAIDTALPKGEEFPWFREFWIEEPHEGAKTLVIYALLDSPSVTGAYKFIATPGAETVIDVTSRVFFRHEVEKVGIAPLTSMYFFGENNRSPGYADFRPEVHDSDGLQIAFGTGEWLWRPLHNPKHLQVNSFKAINIKGFGLLQRDLKFASYEDLEAFYHERPSLWIEPTSDWGEGQVELVQIPTRDEIHDNVVAYWVPKDRPQTGTSRAFSYRMRWSDGSGFQPPGARVVATRSGFEQDGAVRRIVVDFSGDNLTTAQESELAANVSASAGATVRNITVQKNDADNTWRLSFELLTEPVSPIEKVLPDKGNVIELRAFLTRGVDVVSETWSYSVSRKVKL